MKFLATSASVPLLWGMAKASQVQSTRQARGDITRHLQIKI